MKHLLTKTWSSVLWLREYLRDGKDGQYIIQEYSPPRNIDQNSLYWALLNFAEEQTWTSADTFHKYFKITHLPKAKRKRLQCFWKVFYTKEEMTTTKMKKKDFSEYYKKCEQDLAMLWVVLPDTESKDYKNFLLTYWY